MSILFDSLLDLKKAREQLGCLGKKAKAAILYDRLLTEYQETEAAFAAAQTPALSQADVALFRKALEMRITVLEVLKEKHYQAPRIESMMSPSELDAIRRQIEACWNLPAGARDVANMVVVIRTVMNPDGRVRSASIVDSGRANRDHFYRSMAESALRAVLNPRCQPLRLPLEKFDVWRVMVLNFDPREMF